MARLICDLPQDVYGLELLQMSIEARDEEPAFVAETIESVQTATHALQDQNSERAILYLNFVAWRLKLLLSQLIESSTNLEVDKSYLRAA